MAWLITLLALIFMLPWARWLLRSDLRRAPLLVLSTTIALSLGTLTLIMLLIGMLGLTIDWRLVVLICAVITVPGFFLPHHTDQSSESDIEPRGILKTVALIVIVMICSLIIFNAIYWPIYIDDALTIYAWHGKQIAITGKLPHGALYEAYPMMIPLAY